MSYTAEIRTTQRDCDRSEDHIAVTTFAGGELGHMVQITVGDKYVTLTVKQLRKFRRLLEFAEYRSLVDWDKRKG